VSMLLTCHNIYADCFLCRLEEAAEPETLSQETIIDNMSPEEWARLSRVRNIGIAVRPFKGSRPGGLSS
jgi:hypothetical protein